MIVQIHNGARREEERVRRRVKEDTVRVQGGYSEGSVGVKWDTVRVQGGYSGDTVRVQWGTVRIQ